MVMDPREHSAWTQAATVRSFATSPPNDTLIRFVEGERTRCARSRVLDIGCGAGRNAGPLAASGLDVLGIDLSWPMLRAMADRRRDSAGRLALALAPMDRIPAHDRSFDIVIAHGIWNLARSGAEFRRAVSEAARVSKAGAALFVFTFARSTLPPTAAPVVGESFVFTQFSGEPQCFFEEAELVAELASVGFVPDAAIPLTERNRHRPGSLQSSGPAIYEGAFRLIP
jgi:SAM-dependent methyltransferase